VTPDTLRVAAEALPRVHEAASAFSYFGMHDPASRAAAEAVMRALEGWHDFYLLAGTAAVTLVGLLFVSLSFHLDTLLHESRAHLLAAARLTFGNYIYVLTMSLMFLVPNAGPRFIALWVTVASTVFLVLAALDWIRAHRAGAHSTHEHFMVRRRRMAIVGYGLSLASAALLWTAPSPFGLYNFIAPICLILGNAAGTSWDLLVQVGKLKREQERADAEQKAPHGA
jgi:hypothetical protein